MQNYPTLPDWQVFLSKKEYLCADKKNIYGKRDMKSGIMAGRQAQDRVGETSHASSERTGR